MPDSFQVEGVVGAEPARVYQAWMDSREHAAFTGGGEAVVEPWAGGRFTAWDGYIHGILLQVDVGTRIVQTWRTSEFLPEARDSRLVVEFEEAKGGTIVRIRHADLPPSQIERYQTGWTEHYLKPLQVYFSRGARKNELTAAPKAPATAWDRKLVRAKKGEKAESAAVKKTAPAAGKAQAGQAAAAGKPVKAAPAQAATMNAAPAQAATKSVAPAQAAMKKAATMSAASKKAAPKSAAPKKASPGSAASKKASPGSAAPKKASPRSAAPKKAATKSAAPKKAAAKKADGKKSAPKKAAAKKSGGKKSGGKKSGGKKR